MSRILVTGAKGFIGKNLVSALCRNPEHEIFSFDIDSTEAELNHYIHEAEVIIHLAGINRPKDPSEFVAGNTQFTHSLCEILLNSKKNVRVILSSSIQAELDNPYGNSKRLAEDELKQYALQSKGEGIVYRLPNVFGKWCRPNYNSVTATFCHNIARGIPIEISDPSRELNLVYVDDVVRQFTLEVEKPLSPGTFKYEQVPVTHQVTLGELASIITHFREMRQHNTLPDLGNPLIHKLYATYLSYLETDEFSYPLHIHSDPRGELAEFVKSKGAGQIFVSRTRPGITRGNHFHDTKTEKFLVLDGEALIRFRHIMNDEMIEYKVSGKEFRVIDIPPGYTHSIENIGTSDMLVLFWASEIFDSNKPDTYYSEVIKK